ncbi:MAG TPA: hypothetical protein VEX86_06400 [Longimicrobium sp.]|nr:hypothetical protein [Longimicrobium sp.]
MRGYDRGYDYGLRGWPQAQRRREPVRTRFLGGYGGDYRGGGVARDAPVGWVRRDEAYGLDYGPLDGAPHGARPPVNRVTARYNLDYVREQHPGEHPVNYTPYGGDRIGRVGDMREYQAPYQTIGGTRTMRGGGWPVGWERGPARYARDYGYGRDYGRF